jgi:DNA polymerase I-like protein with 3'-5' exonuclease and polymerase domains
VYTTEPTAAAPPGPSQVGTVISKFKRLASRLIVPTTTKCAGLRVAFDIEGNGLLHDATKIHCIAVANLDSDQVDKYGPDQMAAALDHLSRAAYLVAHNANAFDVPVLRRLCNWRPQSDCKVVDTLIAGRLILPNLEDLDDKAAAMGDPKLGKLRGRYSIEAWGARLHIPKVGIDISDWSKWTAEIQERCVADTLICKALWQFLQPDGYSQHALNLEYRVAAICEQITAAGVPFDVNVADQLRQQWAARRAKTGDRLRQQFPGVNLNSRKQLGALLEAKGWAPSQRTEKTRQPKIDDETLESIPALYPEFAGLAEYTILGRRIAQLSAGREAWTAHVDAEGRIHGGLIHIGTPQASGTEHRPSAQSKARQAVCDRMPVIIPNRQ